MLEDKPIRGLSIQFATEPKDITLIEILQFFSNETDTYLTNITYPSYLGQIS